MLDLHHPEDQGDDKDKDCNLDRQHGTPSIRWPTAPFVASLDVYRRLCQQLEEMTPNGAAFLAIAGIQCADWRPIVGDATLLAEGLNVPLPFQAGRSPARSALRADRRLSGHGGVSVAAQLWKWQATQWPSAACFSSGFSVLQRGCCALGQRVWKWQPVGGLMGLGTSPCSMMRLRLMVGSGMGTADSKASVYGWRGVT
jgi:hypothetical protein